MSQPVHDFSRPPVPVAGCAACADLARQRAAARAAYDGSAVTDANVLLRRHHERDHLPQNLSANLCVSTCEPSGIAPDPDGEARYKAVCVSDPECDGQSETQPRPQSVERWIVEHAAEAGHRRYQRIIADFALAEVPSAAWEMAAENEDRGAVPEDGTPAPLPVPAHAPAPEAVS